MAIFRSVRRIWGLWSSMATVALAVGGSDVMADDNVVTWLMPDYPPVTIIHGAHKGTGYADVFLRYFTKQTPEYKHIIEASSMSRVFGLMQQGEPVCHPSLLKTAEREAFVDFSNPVEFALSHHLVVRRDRVAQLAAYREANGSVDIARLLKDAKLKMTYQEKRGYPAIVSEALRAGVGQKHVIQTSSDDEGLFRQLASEWVDYIIAYPDEVRWFSEKLQLPENVRFDYLPIAGLPGYALGHVGCTKGVWGRKVIDRVNEVVAKAGPRPVWIDAAVNLLDSAGAKRYEELFARHSPLRRTSK